jgi:GT2 family glycosyltransferase
MRNPLVSVVIPVQRPTGSLTTCTDAVRRQDFPRKEIIIVAGPGAGRDSSLPPGSEDTRVIRERAAISNATLVNHGLRAARGHVKVLLSPDCTPDGSAWMADMANPFEDDNVGAVVAGCAWEAGGPDLATRVRECIQPARAGSRRAGSVPLEPVRGPCVAFRADLLADIGYLGEEMPPPAEMVELSLRVASAGYSVVHSSTARVLCRAPKRSTLAAVAADSMRHGRADATLERRYGVHWLNAGVYAALLPSLLLLPLATVSLPIATAAALGLFVAGWFLSVRIPLVGWECPTAGLNFALFAAAISLVRPNWSPGLLGAQIHPAFIRQWAWLLAVAGTYILLAAANSARCTARVLRRIPDLRQAPLALLAALTWSLGLGLGYIQGLLPGAAVSRALGGPTRASGPGRR